MLKRVHLHPQVSHQLAAAEKQSNAPAIAAAKAKKIIDALIHGETLTSAGLLRPRTDRRIKNCLKFDLGSGFRLICTREKNAVHVIFFGDHDSCDAWLTRHGRRKLDSKQNVVVLKNTPAPVLSRGNEHIKKQTRVPEISQKQLRVVFKGLLG